MRYMMLIHHDEAALAAAPQKELWADYAAFNEALSKAGVGNASGERLQPSAAATTVRQQGGKTDVLDGPYADTKEQFAGYFFVEAPSLDEAIAWAKRCPSSKYGSIEIRPIVEQTGNWKWNMPTRPAGLPSAWPAKATAASSPFSLPARATWRAPRMPCRRPLPRRSARGRPMACRPIRPHGC